MRLHVRISPEQKARYAAAAAAHGAGDLSEWVRFHLDNAAAIKAMGVDWDEAATVELGFASEDGLAQRFRAYAVPVVR